MISSEEKIKVFKEQKARIKVLRSITGSKGFKCPTVRIDFIKVHTTDSKLLCESQLISGLLKLNQFQQ